MTQTSKRTSPTITHFPVIASNNVLALCITYTNLRITGLSHLDGNVFSSLTLDSNVTACKALDDFIDIRLFREENQTWVEKAVITRIWIGTTNIVSENALEQLQELFDTVAQNAKVHLSAPATHAAQTVSLSYHTALKPDANCELIVVVEESRSCI
jgi:hypothetical protein